MLSITLSEILFWKQQIGSICLTRIGTAYGFIILRIIDVNYLYVCSSCRNGFKRAQDALNIKFSIKRKYYHKIQYSCDLISDVFHIKFFWCQSCYSNLLFTLYDETDCHRIMHSTVLGRGNKRIQFEGWCDTETDSDS